MNMLVFLFPKIQKLFRPKQLRGYFRTRNSFEKRFLKEKTESALYNATNCSRELHHNNLNSKVTLEHSVIVIINFQFFRVLNCTHKIFFLFLHRFPCFLQFSINFQGLSNHLRHWLFA